jgi:hypothetical protein
VVAAACVAAGAAAHGRVPVWAVLVAAGAAVAAVDVAVSRRSLTATDRGSLRLGAVVAAAIAVAAATGALTPRLVVLVGAVTGIATVRVARHPALRAAIARRSYIEDLGRGWPAVATCIGQPHVGLNGPVVDRWPDGHTYPVRVPKGMTIDFLVRMVDELTSALGRRRGDVQVELDADWNTLAYIHVREGDPHKGLSAEQMDPEVTSVADPLLIALYDDAAPFYLRIFDREIGGIDVLVAGDKGSGKSSLLIRELKLIVRVPDVTILVADGAHGRDLGPWETCFYRYVTDPKALLDLVRTLCALVDERERTMRRKGWRVWKPSRRHPVILLVIEEMKVFAGSEYGPDIADCLKYIATRNRATGIVIEGLTQYPNGRNVFSHEVRKGMDNRFQFRMGESSKLVLEKPPRDSIPRTMKGAFHAEAHGDDRGMRARVVWTPDEDRLATIRQWAGKQARIDEEWAAAEQATSRPAASAAGATTRRAQQPEVSPDGAVVVEGEILAVRDVSFPPVYAAPQKRPEMEWDEAKETFRTMLKQAGPDGVTRRQVEQRTGWRRTSVRDHLITPAMDAGWVVYQKRGREHVYVLTREAIPS